MAFCMYCGAAIEEGKEHVCAGSGNPQAANMDFSNVNMGGVQQNAKVTPENNGTQQVVNGMAQNVNGMPANNGMAQNVNGMPVNNGMAQNVNGMPVNNGMAQNVNGMPVNNGMAQNMNGMPMNNGMPMHNGMSQNSQFNQQFNQVSRQAGNYFGDLFGSWLSILKSPVEAGKMFVEKASVGVSIGLLVLQALLTVFFVLICFQGTEMNLAKALFLTLFGSAIFSAAFVGVFYLVVKLFKGETDFAKALAVTGARAVPISVFQAGAVVVLLLAKAFSSVAMVYAVLAIWFFSAVVGVVYVTLIAFEHTRMSGAKIFWAMVVILALVGIVDAICYRVGIPLYYPEDSREYINNMMFNALGGGAGYRSFYYGW